MDAQEMRQIIRNALETFDASVFMQKKDAKGCRNQKKCKM